MIEKHVHGPNAVECEPVFSTEHLDAFLMRAPKGFDADTHLAVLDTYIFFQRGDEYYCPRCIVNVEQCQYNDGRVLNRVTKIDLTPCGVIPKAITNSIHSDPAIVADIRSSVERDTTECLLGIQQFAGPVTLSRVDVEEFKTEFATEYLFYELSDQLLLAAATGNQTTAHEPGARVE